MNKGNKNNLFPYFQPILGVASGKIVGYEALARWHDEEKKIVSAGAFFSRQNGSVSELIEWDRNVRWVALEKFSHLKGNCYLTLNVSSAWIDYVSDLNNLPTLQMIEALKIDRKKIIIEIVDTQGDINKLVKIVKLYRQHGLKVAVDNFGEGFSQLESVMAIRPDIIKVNMRFFKHATKEGVASDVVQLLAQLSKRSGCRIVCEGIETDEGLFFGLRCGAQYLQGFLFSQAEAGFQPERLYEKHIGSLRAKFSNRLIAKQEIKMAKIKKIKNFILRLKERLQDDFDLNELVNWQFEDIGVLRFYLCNQEGKQVSPNFNFTNEAWFTDSSKIGFNWSWRSYFYHLLALERAEEGEVDRFVVSERYKDFNSDQLCKTFSIRLDNERILLVDFVE